MVIRSQGKGPKRFSALRNVQIVLRLLPSEDLEILSRELGVAADQAELKKRPGRPRPIDRPAAAKAERSHHR
jgi:hypothetical protein